MTGITVLKSNIPHGPFTRAEIAQKLVAGEITPDSLAFVEGLAQWTPLRDVLAKVDSAPSPHAPVGTGFDIEQKPAAPAPAAGYSYAATMAPPEHLVYAGFWLRFVAYFVDGIVCCPLWIVAGVFSSGMQASTADATKAIFAVLYLLWLGVTIIACWLYFAGMESSRFQGTLGKMALGLRVTDRQGSRIGFGRASGRFFAKIISALPLDIGFMMAGWTQRKQALHDLIVDTLVVRKPVS